MLRLTGRDVSQDFPDTEALAVGNPGGLQIVQMAVVCFAPAGRSYLRADGVWATRSRRVRPVAKCDARQILIKK